ncbi:MAG: hypothetical protein QOD61_1904 [Solirubrobacteraceae bacterium]|nr:hypothetical protein [Solirubrobacteraceae bacterium]
MTARRILGALVAAAAAGALLTRPTTLPPHPSGGRPPVVVPAPRAPPPAPPPGPRQVTRAFVLAYLAFVYGRLAAADLPDASAYVRRQAAAIHPDPPGVVLAAADPRLQSIGVASVGPGRARGRAAIADGPAAYALVLDLRRRPAGWTVTGLEETS